MLRRPMIIAHRGASGLVEHENSLDAFEAAIAIEADMVEFDVRRTSDNALVVFHDEHLSDGRPLSGVTYAELVAYTSAKGFVAPRLAEVVALTAGRIKLDVEIKTCGYEAEVLEVLLARLDYEDFVVKSFHDACVRTLKILDSRVTAGLLLGVEKPAEPIRERASELFPQRRLSAARADFVSPNHQLVILGFMKRMRSLGMPVYVWTVNETSIMERLIKARVDALITDRPDLALETRRRLLSF